MKDLKVNAWASTKGIEQMLHLPRFSFGCKLYKCGSTHLYSTMKTSTVRIKCLAQKTQHNDPEQAWTQPLGHCAIREDWRSIFKSLKMLPVFWFSSPFQDVLPRLLGTVHSDDEEVFPSSQGRQSLRLAVDKESWHKRLGSGSNTPYPRRQGLFCSVFFFSNTNGSKAEQSIETQEKLLAHFLQSVP